MINANYARALVNDSAPLRRIEEKIKEAAICGQMEIISDEPITYPMKSRLEALGFNVHGREINWQEDDPYKARSTQTFRKE